jgi:hypothetical protein
MPTYYKIDKERKLVMSTASGVVTLADGLAHQDKLSKEPDFDPSFSQLVDLTHVTRLEFSSADVRRLAQKSSFLVDSRRAVLVNSDFVFGLSRMYEVFRDISGEKGILVFRNLEEALDWVLAKNASASG